jgi:glycosyltransferase involved in cell wall biosynthesis
MSASRSVVYLSYDGVAEPLGRSQVLPYVRGLAARGHRIELLTFEKTGTPLAFRRALAPGVRWTALRYHRRPSVPATAFDMAVGAAVLALLAILSRADLFHARSYVTAAFALPVARMLRVPLLFDTRGFLFDERADAGRWPRDGWLYRRAKRIEASLFRRSDAITVLTHSMQRYLRQEYPRAAEIRAPIWVIPTCADLALFSPSGPRDPALAPSLDGARVLAYLGAFGAWYLAEDMARFYLAWRRVVGHARFLVISTHSPEAIRRLLAEAGVVDELVHVEAPYAHVPEMLRWSEAGVFFFPAVFSKRGSAPTKLGEALGCGLPVATTPIGDIEDLLRGEPAGVVVRSLDDAGLERAAAALSAAALRPEVRQAARGLAERWFSLDAGISAYDALYRRLRVRRGDRSTPSDAGWPPPNDVV